MLNVDQNRRRREKEKLLLIYEFDNEEACGKSPFAGSLPCQGICSSMSAITDVLFSLGQIVACSSCTESWQSQCFLAQNFLFHHPSYAGLLAWFQRRIAVLCAEEKEAQEAKSCQSEFQGCFPLFMTEMKRRKTRASEWKGQILLFSAFLLFLDCSEENNLPSQSSALSHA